MLKQRILQNMDVYVLHNKIRCKDGFNLHLSLYKNLLLKTNCACNITYKHSTQSSLLFLKYLLLTSNLYALLKKNTYNSMRKID